MTFPALRVAFLVACAPLAALTTAAPAQVGLAHGLCEPFKLTAADPEPHGYLGLACMSSAGLVAATPAMGLELGALYVFDPSTGAQRFKLWPADADLDDGFGTSVAAEGRHAVAGAPQKDLRGAAYVFDVRTGQELYTLLPSDTAASVSFGGSVAIDAQRVVVGAPGHFPFPPYPGAVYVFDRQTGNLLWRLAPSDLSFGFPGFAFFGSSVSADRGRVLAGAPGDAQFGSAYVFDAEAGTQLHKLLPPTGIVPKSFGYAVDLQGEQAAIGDPEGDGYRGAVHVFDVGSGLHRFTVQAPDGEAGDAFGTSVAIDEQVLAVGASLDEDPPFSGSVYLFHADTGAFIAKLHGYPARLTERFGSSVDLSARTLTVSDAQDSEADLYAGAAYVMRCD